LRKDSPSPSSPPSREEREFLERLVLGDPEAWIDFVERYTPLIYSQVHRCLVRYKPGSHVEQDAGDLYLSVFQVFLEKNRRKFSQFQGRCSLARWVRMVTTSHVIDRLRREREEVSLDTEDAEGLPLIERIPTQRPGAEEDLLEAERREVLRDLLGRLSAEDRLLLSLTYEQEMPAEEIAAALNLSRETVYTRRHRLLRRLKGALEEKLLE